MKNITNKCFKGIASRFSATVMLLALGCVAAVAGSNKLYLRAGADGTPNEFSIVPGQTKTIQVVLENEDPVSYLEFRLVQLNDKLEYEDGTVSKVLERITSSSHKLVATEMQSDMKSWYQFGVLSTSATMAGSSIKGNSGAILEFEIRALDDYVPNTDKPDFRLENVMGCDATILEAKALPMESSNVYVAADVAKFSADEEQILARPLSNISLGVSLDNTIVLNNFQCKVTLPEGVSFNNEDCVTFSDRISENVLAGLNPIQGEENSYVLLIQSVTNDPISGKAGNLFNLNLITNETFAEEDIILSDFIVSSDYSVSYALDDVLSVGLKSVSDPSGDGTWSSVDISLVTDAVLNGSEDSIYDADGDGIVSSADITVVVSKVLGE